MLSKQNPTATKAWSALHDHFSVIGETEMKTLFAEDPSRFEHFSTQFEDLLLDYSKNRIWSFEETRVLNDFIDDKKGKGYASDHGIVVSKFQYNHND